LAIKLVIPPLNCFLLPLHFDFACGVKFQWFPLSLICPRLMVPVFPLLVVVFFPCLSFP
jgi:hypothetical protein